MQNGDRASEDIENMKKTVTFAETIRDSGPGFMPSYQATKKHEDHSRIQNKVLKFLHLGKYDEIDSLFKSKTYTPTDIDDFYKEEGDLIFRWAIVASKSEPLRYLVRTISKDAIHGILSRDGFAILRSFIGGQKVREEDNRGTAESRSLAAEKLKIILGLGDDEVNEFIEKNPNRQALKLTFL